MNARGPDDLGLYEQRIDALEAKTARAGVAARQPRRGVGAFRHQGGRGALRPSRRLGDPHHRLFGLFTPTMFTWPPYASMLGFNAIIVVLTLGLIIPLTAGDFDLSVASTLTLSAMLVAILNVKGGVPIPVAVLVALAVGAFVGAVNAFFILYFRIHSLIVTLGVGYFVNGVVLWVSNSAVVFGQSLTPLVNVRVLDQAARRRAAVLVRADPDDRALVHVRIHCGRAAAAVRRARARGALALGRQASNACARAR